MMNILNFIKKIYSTIVTIIAAPFKLINKISDVMFDSINVKILLTIMYFLGVAWLFSHTFSEDTDGEKSIKFIVLIVVYFIFVSLINIILGFLYDVTHEAAKSFDKNISRSFFKIRMRDSIYYQEKAKKKIERDIKIDSKRDLNTINIPF